MTNKYELVNDDTTIITLNNDDGSTTEKTLKRIRALKDVQTSHSLVKTGDLGGFIESEVNLSQKGNCWIYRGKVYGTTTIEDNAVFTSGGTVHTNCELEGNCSVDTSIGPNIGVGRKCNYWSHFRSN